MAGAKLVSLTPAGRELSVRARRALDNAPSAFATIPPADLETLARVLATLLAGRKRDTERAEH
jgi:hypothetical protein